jgi:hypothetical protein
MSLRMASLPAPKTLRHPSRLTSFPWNDNQDLKVYATIRTPLPLIVVRALPVAMPPPQACIASSLDRTASVGSSHGSNASFHSTPIPNNSAKSTLHGQHRLERAETLATTYNSVCEACRSLSFSFSSWQALEARAINTPEI